MAIVNKNTIEVTTVNGFRKMINKSRIESINELPFKDMSKSNTVVVLLSGNEIYCSDRYDTLVQLWVAKGDNE